MTLETLTMRNDGAVVFVELAAPPRISLAHRIAAFPAAARAGIKERIDAIALAPPEEFRRDADLFGNAFCNGETQGRIRAAIERGLQTRDWELELARKLPGLAER